MPAFDSISVTASALQAVGPTHGKRERERNVFI